MGKTTSDHRKGYLCGLLVAPLVVLGAACSEDASLSEVETAATFVPSTVDFGTVRVGTTSALSIGFRNSGGSSLAIESFSLPTGFAVRGLGQELAGTILSSGEVLNFDLQFQPTAAQSFHGVVTFVANEIPFDLEVTGKGVSELSPQLSVEPQILDFGQVPVGTTARATVTIQNDAQTAVLSSTLLGASQQPARDGQIFRTVDVRTPLIVEALRETAFQVEFAPPSEASHFDELQLQVVDRSTPMVVQLRGNGVRTLGDDIACAPLDFGAVPRGEVRVQSLQCRAVGGPVQVTGLTLRAPSLFRFPNGPGTPASVSSGQVFTTEIGFESQGDLGELSSAVVVNFQGAVGPGSKEVPIRARVSEPSASQAAIAVQLTWDNFTDLDLYLTLPNPQFLFSPFDASEALECSFIDLEGKTDDWGVEGDQRDNCFLDVDDKDGLGPERINMTNAAAGTYSVYVHQWRGSFGRPTIQLTLGGTPVGQFQSDPLRCNDLWHVGNIEWNGSAGTFVPVNRTTRVSAPGCT